MMSHLFKQYQPTLVVVGNKSTSLNFQYPRRMSRGTSSATTSRSSISPTTAGFGKQTDSEIEHYLVKLSSYLIRYSTVPVIMVGNSTIFHRKPVPKVLPSVTFTDSSSKQRGILDYSSGSYRHNSIGSDVSIESFCGEQINEDGWDCGCPSSNPSRRPSEPSENSSDPLERPVDPLERPVDASTRPSDPSRCPCNQPSESSQRPSDPFAAMLSDISKSSLWDSRNYLESIIADKLPAHFADNKVHQAYISTEQGRQSMLSKTNSLGATAKAYKVKSLISYNEEDEKKNEKMINEKKIKKSISRNSAGSSVSGATEEKSAKKKRSFLQKLGLKK
ncbi:hypothetical protein JCM33374_g966 [Metschnikowia sp. JCM 33374]|nr:hypothetical protein JCM33374_g966 [Metschnikowia sp. JCM 33374]